MLFIPYPHRRQELVERLLSQSTTSRQSWQSTSAPSPVYELANVVLEIATVSMSRDHLSALTSPDLPWAEEHFQERVSGKALNPPPSFIRWPWHSKAEATKFFSGGSRFDHTYPERYWPRDAAGAEDGYLRQELTGDLEDVARLLRRDPWTRQAYLPVWFPEDTGTKQDQRVPCTLGYHFIRNGARLDCNYFLRSCDITRHLHNDLYLTGRLLQWMVEQTAQEGFPYAGKLTVFISNLHLFESDAWRFSE